MKRKFSSIFTRCNSCDRIFRTSSPYHAICRACRDEREMTMFFEWLDDRL